MGMFDNENAADNRMRQFEGLSKPVATTSMEAVEIAVTAASIVTANPIAGAIAKSIGVARKFTSRLGVATLEENIDHLGRTTEMAIARIEGKQDAQGGWIEGIEEKIASAEFVEGISAAVLQSQRTAQKKRLDRMAWILANGVAENDLELESLDDMMRAAAELRDSDIALLGKICISQSSLLEQQRGRDSTYWFGEVQHVWNEFVNSGALDARKHLVYRSSLARLESHGLIQKFREISTAGVGLEPYALLEEGKKFYERLQEIPTESVEPK